MQITTCHTPGPTLQIEQPVLSQLSSTLHQHLSTQFKWGYFLSSTSSRSQLANECVTKTYLAPSSQPKPEPTINQLIRTIPIKFYIRDNIIIEAETPTEILWIHDRQGYQELEVHSLCVPNATFTAPAWYFNLSTLRNRAGSSSDAPPHSHHHQSLGFTRHSTNFQRWQPCLTLR